MAYQRLRLDNPDPDLDTYQQQVLERVKAAVPGYDPGPGDLAYAWGMEMLAEVWDTRQLVTDVGDVVFARAGQTVLGIADDTAAYAAASASVFFDAPGAHSVAQGTQLTYTDPSGADLSFTVSADASATAGTSVDVQIQAVDPGSEFNAVPAGAALSVDDDIAGVTGAATTTAATGGIDAQDDQAYLDKLTANLGTLREAVSNEVDAAVLARNVDGVWRALGVDGWNPVGGTLNQDMTVGMVFLDTAGMDVTADVKTAALAYLTDDARRTVNLTVLAGTPTYTPVGVVFAATSMAGYDPATVQTAAIAAVRDFLDPATFSGGRMEPPTWRGDSTIFYTDVVGAIWTVPGVLSVVSCTVNGGRNDVTLPGVAPLPAPFVASTVSPSPSTVTGTVTPS